jgi:hypothetical protein
MTKVVEGECVPAVHHKTGEFMKASSAKYKARKILEEREGPRPIPGAICRHLCKNDSMAPNGFVCTLHTTWGTYAENEMDKSPEMRAKGGKISANKPDSNCRLEVTCHHCGKVGAKLPMGRWHGDNCRHKPPN